MKNIWNISRIILLSLPLYLGCNMIPFLSEEEDNTDLNNALVLILANNRHPHPHPHPPPRAFPIAQEQVVVPQTEEGRPQLPKGDRNMLPVIRKYHPIIKMPMPSRRQEMFSAGANTMTVPPPTLGV